MKIRLIDVCGYDGANGTSRAWSYCDICKSLLGVEKFCRTVSHKDDYPVNELLNKESTHYNKLIEWIINRRLNE